MTISVPVAKKIVREISQTIHQDVNLMDTEGTIIASTNEKRVGTCHTGAQKIVQEKLDYLEVCTDDEYCGAKIGINMPVYLGNEIIGVLGISGEWQQIERYMKLIRKTTETLLMNDYLQKKEGENKKAQNQFLYNLLFTEKENLPKDFENIGSFSGWDLRLERRCICISLKEIKSEDEKQLGDYLDELEKLLEKLDIRTRQWIVYRELSKITIFLPAHTDVEVLAAVHTIQKKYREHNRAVLKIGIDDKSYCGIELREGRSKAKKSLKFALSDKKRDIVFYKMMTVGLFMDEISERSKREYIQRVFQGMSDEEIRDWIELLEVFFDYEGSINQTAESLFVHKNTVQYQLKKLAALTGYDPRTISNAAIYQTAIWFWNEL